MRAIVYILLSVGMLSASGALAKEQDRAAGYSLDSLFTGVSSLDSLAEPLPGDISSEVAVWNAANDAYAHGEFKKAIEGYKQLIEQGLESYKLYYNLGNAYFRSDSIAWAIVSYKRALRLNPSDGDAAYNLGVAESRTATKIERLPEFFMSGWWRDAAGMLPSDGWAVLSLIFFVLTAAGAVYYLLASSVGGRKLGFTAAVLALFFFIVSVCVATSQKRNYTESKEAVVMVSAAAVKSSPGASGKDLFILNEGVAVRLGERVGHWRQITIANGEKGWILERQIEII
ncbi:MAG: tetratricopeptide repeat protein [Rikenellaceae bacterium]|nr:tetratricopeptide repeat protein [Rikenellaceae bacterium]MDE7355169.1 tetratricopeptide repeat protein [Rikenellaceae bacterium]